MEKYAATMGFVRNLDVNVVMDFMRNSVHRPKSNVILKDVMVMDSVKTMVVSANFHGQE